MHNGEENELPGKTTFILLMGVYELSMIMVSWLKAPEGTVDNGRVREDDESKLIGNDDCSKK